MFPMVVHSHSISFEIPDDDFLLLLRYESVNGREFELELLSDMLDRVDDVNDVDYNGHYGPSIFAEFDLDDSGNTPQAAEFHAIMEDFFRDLRLISAIMPELLRFPRHDIDLLTQYDDTHRLVRRRLLYGDDSFLIADSAKPGCVTILHRNDGKLAAVDAYIPASIEDIIGSDRSERSFHSTSRRPITMSKDLPGVKEWVSGLVLLEPFDAAIPTIDVEHHPLAAGIPNGTRPILAHPAFIVADGGPDLGLSVTFRSDGEFGRKWLTDGARAQMLENIAASGKARGRLVSWILGQLPREASTIETISRSGIHRP